jgi:hypothetical protein
MRWTLDLGAGPPLQLAAGVAIKPWGVSRTGANCFEGAVQRGSCSSARPPARRVVAEGDALRDEPLNAQVVRCGDELRRPLVTEAIGRLELSGQASRLEVTRDRRRLVHDGLRLYRPRRLNHLAGIEQVRNDRLPAELVGSGRVAAGLAQHGHIVPDRREQRRRLPADHPVPPVTTPASSVLLPSRSRAATHQGRATSLSCYSRAYPGYRSGSFITHLPRCKKGSVGLRVGRWSSGPPGMSPAGAVLLMITRRRWAAVTVDAGLT